MDVFHSPVVFILSKTGRKLYKFPPRLRARVGPVGGVILAEHDARVAARAEMNAGDAV
jgi:hypothetical protein